jgi:uncharacterized protein (TIGR00730 family)
MSSPPSIRNLGVYCASSPGINPSYQAVAAELGHALATHNIGLIYGGANVGLMKTVADAALAAGGHVTGVIPEVLVDLEVTHQGISELHVVDTMHTRKALIALPGGYGTLEELFEVLAWQTLRLHTKPILLLNVDGFYDSLLTFLDHAVTQGILKPKNPAVLFVATTVEEALVKLSICS